MKKLTIASIAFLLLAGSTTAVADNFKPGFHIGGSVAKLESGQLRYDDLSGVCFGLRANREISRFMDYQFELNFVKKGAVTDIYSLVNKAELTSAEGSIAVDYLELPLMVKAGPNLTSAVNPSILAGIYVAWNLRSTVSYENLVADPLEEFDVAGSDFGFVAGAALDFSFQNRDIGLEFRYSRGIKESIDRSTGESLINSVMTLVIYVTP